jgi:hypothetical protein
MEQTENQQTYYDGLFVQVSLISAPWDKDPYLDVFMQLPSGSLDLDALKKDIEAIASINRTAQEGPSPFKSNVSIGHTSWGADATVITYLLQIAVGITSNSVLLGIGLLTKKYKGRQLNQHAQDYTDDQLLEHARALVIRQYGLTPNEVKAKSIERSNDSPDTARVTLLHNELPIIVTVRMINGVAVLERRYRELP